LYGKRLPRFSESFSAVADSGGMKNETDHELDQQAMDADDYYQNIVLEDAASMPDGCLGLIGFLVFGLSAFSFLVCFLVPQKVSSQKSHY
jgi:hypothetical protein